MSAKVYCHWGCAEDVCVVVSKDDCLNVEDTYQIPMTRSEARDMANKLLKKADECDRLERSLDDYMGG